MNANPVYLIDDDEDDYEFLKLVMEELGLENKIKYFRKGEDFLTYLKASPEIPFMILCDVNVPPLNGFEIRKLVIEDPAINYKSVPFIFWSNSVSETQIQKGYDLSVHGFFVKGSSTEDMKKFIKIIIEYWKLSLVPTLRLT